MLLLFQFIVFTIALVPQEHQHVLQTLTDDQLELYKKQYSALIKGNTQNATSIGQMLGGFNLCRSKPYGRGIGRLPKGCPDGYTRGGRFCYKCQPGDHLIALGPVCNTVCRDTEVDSGITCYTRPLTKLTCGSCPDGYHHTTVCSCSSSRLKDFYTALDRSGTSCTSSEVKKGGLCYSTCKDGYKGVGPMCWPEDPSISTDNKYPVHCAGSIFGGKQSDCTQFALYQAAIAGIGLASLSAPVIMCMGTVAAATATTMALSHQAELFPAAQLAVGVEWIIAVGVCAGLQVSIGAAVTVVMEAGFGALPKCSASDTVSGTSDVIDPCLDFLPSSSGITGISSDDWTCNSTLSGPYVGQCLCGVNDDSTADNYTWTIDLPYGHVETTCEDACKIPACANVTVYPPTTSTTGVASFSMGCTTRNTYASSSYSIISCTCWNGTDFQDIPLQYTWTCDEACSYYPNFVSWATFAGKTINGFTLLTLNTSYQDVKYYTTGTSANAVDSAGNVKLILTGAIWAMVAKTGVNLYVKGYWTFFQNKDNSGNDLIHVQPYSLNYLKGQCLNTAGCVGFNTNGYLKNTRKFTGFATFPDSTSSSHLTTGYYQITYFTD